MVSLPTHPDVVIIGAGAAGIAAGRELVRRGHACLILEARERIGGRAWTVPYGASAPLDLGCEWLHSADRNVLATIAPACGFAIDRSPPPWTRHTAQPNFDLKAQDAFGEAYAAFEARLAAAAEAAARKGRDRPAADLLDPSCRWNGMMDAISTYYNGASLSRVSVVDYGRYRDTEENWRVVGGYGALIAAMGRDLPIRCSCAVRIVDTTGRTVKVETDAGTVETRAVIVTVPTNLIASGAIAFRPARDAHRAAAAGLPLGIADKLYLALDRPEVFAPDTRLIGAVDRAEAGSYTIRPRGRPMIEGYFGGEHAAALEKGGLAAFAQAARDEIAHALGRDFARKLKPIRATAWALDRFSGGSYSHALPGHADARAILRAPVDGRLVFAGEATSPHFFSTAHGAFESGLAAVQALGF